MTYYDHSKNKELLLPKPRNDKGWARNNLLRNRRRDEIAHDSRKKNRGKR